MCVMITQNSGPHWSLSTAEAIGANKHLGKNVQTSGRLLKGMLLKIEADGRLFLSPKMRDFRCFCWEKTPIEASEY